MALIPLRYYVELNCFAKEVEKLFDRFFGEGFILLPSERLLWPPLSIDETKEDLIICLDIPEFSAEELEITFHNNILTIEGKKKQDKKRKPRRTQPLKQADSFVRRIGIYTKVRKDESWAQFKRGRLIITLPKLTKPFSMQLPIT